ISNEEFKAANPDLVVGGFPCQDYSVARSLSNEKGIQGKKGVLFWEIKRVLEATHPKYVLLENVDRLLKSPSKQRGRDFCVMVVTFRDLNYSVEWRVINAADYGFVQRRRRVFIFAYKNDLSFASKQKSSSLSDVVLKNGFFAKPFPVEEDAYKNRAEKGRLLDDIVEISDTFSFSFHTAGAMIDGDFYTAHVIPKEKNPTTLGEIILPSHKVDEKFYLNKEDEEKFDYLRGYKKIERTSADGHKYYYSEGGRSPTDALDKPGRPMLTSEDSRNRSTHIIERNERKRLLIAIECERLNGFPDNWTSGMTDRMRYFCMGNALVVGVVELIGHRIEEIDEDETISHSQLEFLLG